ncbi:hypothetical protein ACFOY4_19910 [Actinomadura syzygii]|uniref:Uncharacterized protein n=1 Tax=Actinomadura syzygii TaxID=1427538 RepID=A0A5D0U1H3_9ACTN|nr:hypothetical protein [Actinomadura syzygii]TYC12421.1 hypothetical protein FXF65_24550 [Actinomadura syzygii]
MTDVSSRLRLVTDTSPAAWLETEMDDTDTDSGVRALLPGGFAAYARILHPADSPSGEPVRWHEVAGWTGRSIHPRVQFKALSRPASGAGDGPPPWDEPPERGELSPPLLSALCAVLARHTAAPDRCWFCLWSGWGWITGATSLMVAFKAPPDAQSDAPPEPSPPDPEPGPAFDDAPRVRLPWRDYVMFEGPLDAATELGHRGAGFFFPQSPNLFWPDDRSWCAATDIDLDSTYVGGPAGLIDDLLGEPALEVVRVEPTDPIDEDSDQINR